MPAGAGLFEPRGSGLSLLKSTFNAENFIRWLSWSIFNHFVAIQCRNVQCIQKLRKNSLKTPFSGVQGRSRSSTLINLKSLSPVLVMISSMFVPICNRFHATRDDCGKIYNHFLGGGSCLWRPPAPASLNLGGRDISATVFTLFEPIMAKWRLFKGYPSLTPSFEGNPCTQRHEVLSW